MIRLLTFVNPIYQLIDPVRLISNHLYLQVSVLTDHHAQDLVLTLREGGLKTIPVLNPNAMALHFTVFFPNGDRGWDKDERHATGGKTVTAKEFAVYHLAERDPRGPEGELLTSEQIFQRVALAPGEEGHLPTVDYIHRGGRLFQEKACMDWITVEDSRLDWSAQNQKKLRADSYRNVRQVVDAQGRRRVAGEPRGDMLYPEDRQLNYRVGAKILPSSKTGSPRWYFGKYQDSMRICQEYGPPTFFITFTGNPKWKEITSNLAPGMKTEDRPDLVARVFKQKYDALMFCLIKRNLLGTVVAHMAVVEW